MFFFLNISILKMDVKKITLTQIFCLQIKSSIKLLRDQRDGRRVEGLLNALRLVSQDFMFACSDSFRLVENVDENCYLVKHHFS